MKEIAKILLDINAVTLSPQKPYTWASGIKSPIYCDNRLIFSYPKERTIVENSLVELIREKFPQTEYIMGTASAGIGHAAIVSDIMKLPMGYVRSKGKDHGKKNQIEGKIFKGAKTLVIEDLFSTGKSSIDAALALKESGFDVIGIVSIFTYNLKSCQENFQNYNLKKSSLTDYDELLSIALERAYIKEEDLKKLQKFKINPSDPSWMD